MKVKLFNLEFQINLLKLKRIKLHKFIIDKSEFDRLDSKSKKRFTMITLFLSDLHLLFKNILLNRNAEMPIKELKPIEWISYSIQLRIVVAKIFEIWNFFNKNHILADQNTFSNELKAKAATMSNYFKKNNEQVNKLFSFVRNKMSFHYEYQDGIDSILDIEFKRMNEIELWISDDDANSMFVASDLVVVNSILKKMKDLNFSGTDDKLFKQLFNLTMDTAKICRSFCISYLDCYYISVLNIIKGDIKKLDVPSIKKVEIPLFLTK